MKKKFMIIILVLMLSLMSGCASKPITITQGFVIQEPSVEWMNISGDEGNMGCKVVLVSNNITFDVPKTTFEDRIKGRTPLGHFGGDVVYKIVCIVNRSSCCNEYGCFTDYNDEWNISSAKIQNKDVMCKEVG